MARSKPMTLEQPRAWRKRVGRVRHPATLAVNVTADVYRIIWSGRTFHLRRPIDLTVRRRGPYLFVGYEPVGIEGYGRNEQAALESFADVFAATWDWIATARDSQLGGEAQELRRKLRDLVEFVEASA
jgi:hypothetical protein